MRRKLSLLVGIVVLTASLLACQLSSFVPTIAVNTPVPPLTTLPAVPVLTETDLASQQNRLMVLYQQYSPGVVSIKTTTGQGSGWVYSGEGYIVTNNHVVGNETEVEVDFASGLKAYGQVIGTDVFSDLAVIRVDVPPADLHPLPMGDSDLLQVGQTVVAIGNPFGYSGTMTTGIISALGRALPSESQSVSGGYFSNANIIQTDAALNPGNSGGPLFNLNGEVIGINSAIQTSAYTTTNEPINSGIGFSISINTVKRVIPNLILDGSYDYPWLGISTQDDMPLTVIEALELGTTTGAYVVDVTSGGPSEQAGLRAGTVPVPVSGYGTLYQGGDLIIAVDGQPVVTFADLIGYLYEEKSPGDSVTLTVLRGSQQLDLKVTLGVRP
jgi:S1-C subfamily serine protease